MGNVNRVKNAGRSVKKFFSGNGKRSKGSRGRNRKRYSRSPGHPSQMKSQNTRGKLKSNRNKNRRTYSRSPGHPSQMKRYSRSPGHPSRRKPATRNQVDKIGDRQTSDYGSIANDAADTYDEIRNTKQVKKIRKSLWERTKNKLSK